jgi:DNA-binding transcriptional MerR regulator
MGVSERNGGRMLTMKSVQQRLRITDTGVRDLERRGLLHPERTETGIRIFSEEEVEDLAAKRDAIADERRMRRVG